MQTRLPLGELARRVMANRDLKLDYIAPTSQIRMIADTDDTPRLELPVAPGAAASSFGILPTAHQNIATHADIPQKYYDRMLRADPDLLAQNVNRWFADKTAPRMVRSMGGDVRALLSDRYARIENEEIAETVLPILLEDPALHVVSCELTDRRMYIQATTTRARGEVKVGDEVQAGVIISNSEIGHGAVSIRPMIYRLVCLNGLVIPDKALSARHVGRQIASGEDLNAIFSDEARKADDKALLLKVRDVVRHAMSEAGLKQHIEKMRALTEPTIQRSPEAAVTMLARKTGILDREKPSILEALMKGGDMSAWGLVNAVTAQAHSEPDYDRAVDFEAMGGQMLDLPATEWREILEAA